MTSVSVAMATYNGARFLRAQLESIAAQTLLPAELVITDDCSTDDTISIASAFAQAAPFPVKIWTNPTRLGYRANFLEAMLHCSSDIIALCDQDDVWEPTKLERASEPFQEPDVLLTFHEAWLIDCEGLRTGLARILPLPERNAALSLFPMVNPFGFSMLLRRELLMFSDLWPFSIDNLEGHNRMAHDQWLFFLASVFGTIAFITEPLAGYRQHANNAYGAHREVRGFLGRMGRWVDWATTEFGSFSVAAGARAAILEKAIGRLDGSWQSRARVAASDYQDLARNCALRSEAYRSPRALLRMRAWLTLVRRGGYKGSRWAFGRKTALKDLLYLFLPRMLLRALPVPVHTGSNANQSGAVSPNPSS